ncbi:MAG: DinB family protein [Pseudomonadota bacterium]
MITPAYCVTMTRYNAWQHRQLVTALDPVPEAEVVADRGAFFGSILGTLNHVLWADQIWMSRFDDRFDAPGGGIPNSPSICADYGTWKEVRTDMDARMTDWAGGVTAAELAGDVAWYSGAAERDVVKPRAFCITHMFNHATHHRGQVHTMMTSAGLTGNTSDLFLLPPKSGEGA